MQSASSCWRVYSHRPSARPQVQTVWTGPTTTFAKVDFADWTLPQNQDRLTDNVWITRGDSHGIFNIAMDKRRVMSMTSAPRAPSGLTEPPRTGNRSRFAAWELWAASNPPSTVGQVAVLHLVQDDVYLDIKFLSWTGGAARRRLFLSEKLARNAGSAMPTAIVRVNDTDASIVGAHWMSTGASGATATSTATTS